MIVATEATHAAQRSFRRLLEAFAHPGRVIALAAASFDAPNELSPALAAAALALFDGDVAVWLAPMCPSGVERWLRARTDCRIARVAGDAHFALVLDPLDALPIERWNAGTAEDPEDSATLLVQVAALAGGPPAMLRGPGIEDPLAFAPYALPPNFWREWASNNARYPCGIDSFFFDERHVAGLPRTTLVEHV